MLKERWFHSCAGMSPKATTNHSDYSNSHLNPSFYFFSLFFPSCHPPFSSFLSFSLFPSGFLFFSLSLPPFVLLVFLLACVIHFLFVLLSHLYYSSILSFFSRILSLRLYSLSIIPSCLLFPPSFLPSISLWLFLSSFPLLCSFFFPLSAFPFFHSSLITIIQTCLFSFVSHFSLFFCCKIKHSKYIIHTHTEKMTLEVRTRINN